MANRRALGPWDLRLDGPAGELSVAVQELVVNWMRRSQKDTVRVIDSLRVGETRPGVLLSSQAISDEMIVVLPHSIKPNSVKNDLLRAMSPPNQSFAYVLVHNVSHP